MFATMSQQQQQQQQQRQHQHRNNPANFQSLEIEQASGSNNNNSNNLKTENSRLKMLVWLFALVALLAIGGLVAGVVIAIQQNQRAVDAENIPPTITTVYYFNDDQEAPLEELPGGGILDPIAVNNSTASNSNSNSNSNSTSDSTSDSGSFTFTAEDLLTDDNPAPIVDRVPVNDPIVIEADP